ncbi:MAG: sigma-70 family RNA polymerase sigma factor [Micropruina sp.]|nr:MAG: sigma-70 family RNA polymerase sigma factor [Micropruina sp.]
MQSAGREHAEESVWERAAASFAAWRSGRQTALDDLVRALTPVLWHVVRAYGLTAAAAEDVVQSAFLTLVRNAQQISEPAAVGGWLLTTARRAAWRARTADAKTVTVDDVELAPRLASTPSAESVAVDRVSAADLWAWVGTLDERCQRLLRVVAFDDRPDYAGLASELGMPIGSIGPTRRRCLDKLRTALQEG